MATKKSSRKKKNSTSRRNIIFLIIATVLSALIIWATISAARQEQLEREDREKFAVLEADMEKLKSELNTYGNGGEWALEKTCQKPGIKFYTGEAGSCRITIGSQDQNVVLQEDLKAVLGRVGDIESEGYDRVAEENFIGFTFSESREMCSVYFIASDQTQRISNVEFSCGRPALHMYYPER